MIALTRGPAKPATKPTLRVNSALARSHSGFDGLKGGAPDERLLGFVVMGAELEGVRGLEALVVTGPERQTVGRKEQQCQQVPSLPEPVE